MTQPTPAIQPHSYYAKDADDFATLPIREFFDIDSRPTFVVDLSVAYRDATDVSQIAYANPSVTILSAFKTLFETHTSDQSLGETIKKFWAWVVAQNTANGSDGEDHYTFQNWQWTRSTLRSRWRVIHMVSPLVSGVDQIRDAKDNASRMRGTSQSTIRTITGGTRSNGYDAQFSAVNATTSTATLGARNENISDWTSSEEPTNITPYVRFIRSLDWSKTGLGAMNTWTTELRNACLLLMSDPRAAVLTWGVDNTAIWNEAYVETAGKQRHPSRLGLPFRDVFPEVPGFSDILYKVKLSRVGLSDEDSQFYLERDGLFEEKYYSFTLIPMYERDEVRGVYNPVSFSTKPNCEKALYLVNVALT